MSTTPAVRPQTVVRVPEGPREIKIVSHSTLFYWWPVWAAGFILTIITAASGTRMAVVPAPPHTVYASGASGKLDYKNPKQSEQETTQYEVKDQDVIVLPQKASEETRQNAVPRLHMAPSKNLGVFYAFILLLVITITNIPLRGLWSVMVIVCVVFLIIILALMRVWNDVLTYFSFLDIRINMGGYLLISSVLFVIWAIVVFLFDKQLYMIFSPGQLRVRLEIGEGETAYDTTGMTIQKQRSDLFRHWILGLGSGDLIVRTSGAQAHHFDLPNVLFLGRKVREIEDMLRSRPVVAGNV
jgi:hypothetical protein